MIISIFYLGLLIQLSLPKYPLNTATYYKVLLLTQILEELVVYIKSRILAVQPADITIVQ